MIFLAIPLPPGAPDVVDWSERHMDLKWQEPLDDGGAAVTSYHIEVTNIFLINIFKYLDNLFSIYLWIFFRPRLEARKKTGNYGKPLIQTEQKPPIYQFRGAKPINLELLPSTKQANLTPAILQGQKKLSPHHVSCKNTDLDFFT